MRVLKSVAEKKENLKHKRSVRMSDRDWAQVQNLAKKYAHGNTSDWLRDAALNYKPRASDLVHD